MRPDLTATAIGSPNLIWDALEHRRDARPQLRCHEDGEYRAFNWDEWRTAAERSAAGLRARGVVPGTRVGCVLTNALDVCSAILGIWLAGGVIVSLPGMRRGMRPQEYMDQLARLCRSAGASMLLLEDRFVSALGEADFGVPLHSYSALGADGAIEPEPPAGDDLAFVQFSSGSTSDPKGSMLSMAAITEQERMLWERLEVDERTQGVMWLPLSHDMGLFGCLLLSWVTGMRLAISGGDRFLRRPQTWFDDAVELQATIFATPNFGVALGTRKARKVPPKGSFPLRTVVLGGERIEWDTLEEADAVLGPHGVTLQTFTPAYGLAEATLAVTMKELDRLPHAMTVHADRAYAGELAPLPRGAPGGRTFVSCGPPVDGVEVRIEGPGEVGRICVRSPALADGYLDHPRATAERFVDGELITEDIGFVHEGELYVLGRTDDVIPIGGRNVHARDVERGVEECAGIRPGCSVLLEVAPEGSDPRLVLVVESYAGDDELEAVADRVAEAAFHSCGIRISECVFLQAGELPKTPSGKVQRFRCRKLAEDRTGESVRRSVPL